MTDLGHVFDGLADVMGTLDGVFLESNHDAGMLRAGSYPAYLKDRIAGPGGHISNGEAAALIERGAGGRLKWACLAHLSEENNDPDVALHAHKGRLGNDFPIAVASRYQVSRLFEV
jgi:phosphoribosyl 1,2-cyclic phosphodiesterase